MRPDTTRSTFVHLESEKVKLMRWRLDLADNSNGVSNSCRATGRLSGTPAATSRHDVSSVRQLS
jgi:hypothetical protein